MSSAGAKSSRRRGRYVTKACNGCRRRRCKCDGVQPICGTCAATGHECSWNSESDARRPATKQLAESLRVKIQVLEAEVARLRADSPLGANLFLEGSSNFHDLSLASAGNSAEGGLISGALTIPAGPNIPHSPPAETSSPSPPLEGSTSTSANQFTPTIIYKYIFQIDTTLPINEQPADTQLSLVCDWKRYLPDLDNVQFSRAEHDTILSRCFKYGTSWLLGLVPEIFLHDMLYSLTSASHSASQARLQHYTPMLHCAIMAFASAFSDDPTIRSCTTREKFAMHAKRWLDEEIGQPVMSLVQSLALLAEYHCALGQREAGYMYMGMSIRAARGMISTSEQAQWASQGITGYPESTTREWHFWSTFAQDKLMSLDLGRSPDMPIPHAGVNLPSVEPELDNQPWPTNPTDTPAVNKNHPKIITLTFLESCKLMVIVTRILEATQPLRENVQGGTVALNLHLQLDTWFNNLPEGLLVWARSTRPLPHVIILHICYWWLVIYLHQPFYHLTQSSHGPLSATDLSVKMCNRGAHKIVQLLNIFDHQHGLRFFPRNMLQAVSACGEALLRESAASPPGAAKKRATAHDGVGVCLRALRAVSITWPCAEAFANELEGQLEEQRPLSNLGSEMEVDELAEDPIAASDSQAGASLLQQICLIGAWGFVHITGLCRVGTGRRRAGDRTYTGVLAPRIF